MEYTTIPDWYEARYLQKFRFGTDKQPNFSPRFAREDPTVFGYYMLGIKLRIYQAFALDCITGKLPEITGPDRKKFILCWSRQIGKTTMMKVLKKWAAYYNKYPSGTTGETKIFAISRTDRQAKQMLEDIRSMTRQGDILMSQVTKSKKIHSTNWISQYITEPNNTEQITYANAYGKRSYIKSFPPTDSILGSSADIGYVDEAHRLQSNVCPDPDEWFNRAYSPLFTATDGRSILTSTPNGTTGFFYDLFDPDDTRKVHEYFRIWFPYTICDDESVRAYCEKEIARLEAEGKHQEAQQEYWARFNTKSNAFFLTDKIDAGIDTSLVEEYGSSEPTSLGIDYGMTNSQTVFTISRGLTTLRQIAYEPGDAGLTWEDDIDVLVKQYNCEYIVPDDCPEGYMTNNRLMQKYGKFPAGKVSPISFKSDKNKMYYAYRKRLYAGDVKYPKIIELIQQMRQMQEIPNKVNVSIEKSPGGRDDRVDSEVLSKYHYLDMEKKQEVGVTTQQWEDPYQDESNRGDAEWENLNNEWEDILKQVKEHTQIK